MSRYFSLTSCCCNRYLFHEYEVNLLRIRSKCSNILISDVIMTSMSVCLLFVNGFQPKSKLLVKPLPEVLVSFVVFLSFSFFFSLSL